MQEQLREDVIKIRESQAAQEQMLKSIMQQVQQSNQATTQQGVQIGTLVTDVQVLKTQFLTYTAENNAWKAKISDWQSDALNVFIPRKEHEALNLPTRVKALEDAQRTESEGKFNFLQWLIATGIPILLFLFSCILTAYSVLHK